MYASSETQRGPIAPRERLVYATYAWATSPPNSEITPGMGHFRPKNPYPKIFVQTKISEFLPKMELFGLQLGIFVLNDSITGVTPNFATFAQNVASSTYTSNFTIFVHSTVLQMLATVVSHLGQIIFSQCPRSIHECGPSLSNHLATVPQILPTVVDHIGKINSHKCSTWY